MKSLRNYCALLFCLFFVFFAFAKNARSEVVYGILEKLIVEGRPDSFYLNTGERRIPFHPPPHIRLPSGSKMNVEGDWIGGKFVGKEIKRLDYDDDWSTPPNITKGNVRTAILMSYTPDKPPPKDATREAVDYEAFDNPDSSLNAFYKEASLDQNGNPQIWFTGDTFGWYVLPQDSIYYDGSYDLIMEDTIKVADKDVDFSKYDTVIIVTWNLFGSSAAYDYKLRFNTDDGVFWLSSAFLSYDSFFTAGVKQHEIGHTFGWQHSGGALLPEDGFCKIDELIFGNDYESCVIHTYFDNHDIMGNSSAYPLPSCWRKEKAGWFKPEQCLEVREGMTFWIYQRELPSEGIKLAEIPTGFNASGEPTSYSLELFVDRLGKFDKDIINDGTKTGVSLRYHAGYYAMGSDGTGDNDSISFYLDEYYNWVLFARDYYRNEEFGFEVKVLGYEGTGTASRAQVQVEFFCPGKVAPTVSLDVEPKEVYAGDTVDFNVSIQNEGQIGCGTQTCALAITKPLQANLGQVVETGAYQTTNTSFSVIIPADTLPGTYEVELSATDIDEQTIVGTTTDTITIKSRPIPTPTPKPSPTPSPTPDPSPTPIPSPSCGKKVLSVEIEPVKLKLHREESSGLTVRVFCEDGFPIPGEKVIAKIKNGKKRINIEPAEYEFTDNSGEARFIVSAKSKTGNARISFTAGEKKNKCKIKVIR